MAITYRGERFEGYNKPKRTPNHPEKSHAVLAKEGDKIRLIRFGQKGADNKPPRKGESEADKAKRRSFKARFAKQIEKGRKDKTASAAYWADRVKWLIVLSGSIILSTGDDYAKLQFESAHDMPAMQAGKIS